MIDEFNNLNTKSGLWLLADITTTRLLDFLYNHPMIGWGIAVFFVVAMAIVVIAGWTGNFDKIIIFAQTYLLPPKPEFTQAQRLKAREDLIKILLKQVVKRLENSLHHKIWIDLKREEQRQRVGQGHLAPVQTAEIEQVPETFIKRTFQRFLESTPPNPVSVQKSTQALFEREDIQGRLLILGEPGAGKTHELLVLARDLLTQAQQSPELPIPVIFELSAWKAEPEFSNWLAQQLLDKYNISVGISQYWMKSQQLLPLLDGLDELRGVDGEGEVTSAALDPRQSIQQIQCVRDINAFLDRSSLSLVVCCRRQDYEVIETQGEYLKSLQGEICLQPLEDQQIRDYLQTFNRMSLWDALNGQPELLKLAHSPLCLLMLMVAYQGKNIRSLEELLDQYIYIQLHDGNHQGAYPPGKAPTPAQTLYYLSWLATHLDSEETTEFLIEKLQPSWLDTLQSRQLYRWIVGLYFGLLFGLFFGLLSGLLVGLFFGLTVSLFYGLNEKLLDIEISERRNSLWNLRKKNLLFSLFFGLTVGLFFGLIYDLRGGLFFGLMAGLMIGGQYVRKTSEIDVWDKIHPNQEIRAIIKSNLICGLGFGQAFGVNYGLIDGLVGGLMCALISILILGLKGGRETSEIDIQDKINPNQGIRNSIRNELVGGLIYGLFFGLMSSLIFGLISGLIFGLIFGLLITTNTGFQHLSLRLALSQSGVSPWNYSRFLDHAENHRFIQRTGGRYRFVHDLLRKRFAATYQEH